MREVTEGTLLGGMVRYRQFAAGHRSGFEPVLLAAAVTARAGDAVLDCGTGAGAALLCLGHRVAGVAGVGLEIDPATVALANENFKNNGLKDFSAVRGDATSPDMTRLFDHALSNPPWHDAAGTTSPDPGRALAHHAGADLLARWIGGMIGCLTPRGYLTLILPATTALRAASLLRVGDIGAIKLLPLWPRAGKSAGQVILSGRRGAKGPDGLLPGLVLHDAAGITAEADAILRGGAALTLGV